MYNHAPPNYHCPICLAINGAESEETWIKQADIFYRDDFVVGFISSKFVKGNEGHPLIVPVQHIENLYDLSLETSHHMAEVIQRVALVLKSIRRCDGVTVLQNNEPAGDQHAFHYHVHLFPRFNNDRFHDEMMRSQVSNPEERIAYAQQLREQLK